MKSAKQTVISTLRLQAKECLELAKKKSSEGDIMEAIRLMDIAMQFLDAIQIIIDKEV